MAYNRYTEQWINVSDPSNPGDATPIDAEAMQWIEDGISDAHQKITKTLRIIDANDTEINNKVDTLRFKLTKEFREPGEYIWTPTEKECTAIFIIIAGGNGGAGGLARYSSIYTSRSGEGGYCGTAIISPIMSLREGVGIPIVVGKGGEGGNGACVSGSADNKSTAGKFGDSSSCFGITASNEGNDSPLCGIRYPSKAGNSDGYHPLFGIDSENFNNYSSEFGVRLLSLAAGGGQGERISSEGKIIDGGGCLSTFLGLSGSGGTKDSPNGKKGDNGCGGGGGAANNAETYGDAIYGDGGNGGDGYVAIYTLVGGA